jgi:hypothetical protein
MEMMWERYQSIAREEQRKEEVLGVFEGIAVLSRRRAEIPVSPPWEVGA